MARPVKQRKILSPYSEISFFPVGGENDSVLHIPFLAEELESIKLIDYENLDHKTASQIMRISRPTFTRIYKRARIKISTSLVEKRPLKLSGENTYFDDNWMKCEKCECIFNVFKKGKSDKCPVCESINFKKVEK
jgi:predicted DNA-binding protein (UPF0251 family)